MEDLVQTVRWDSVCIVIDDSEAPSGRPKVQGRHSDQWSFVCDNREDSGVGEIVGKLESSSILKSQIKREDDCDLIPPRTTLDGCPTFKQIDLIKKSYQYPHRLLLPPRCSYFKSRS